MNIIKAHKNNLIMCGIYFFIIILLSILNQLFLPINISKYLIIIMTFCISFKISYKEGRKRQNKGYLAGIKVSIIGIVLFIFTNAILIHNQITIKNLIYYLIFILINIYGSILGINKKAS